MTEVISSELCRESRLPAARDTHGTLALNGHELGLDVVKGGLTKELLARHFRDVGGELYDGGFQRDITEAWEQIGGDEPTDQVERLELIAAARAGSSARRFRRDRPHGHAAGRPRRR